MDVFNFRNRIIEDYSGYVSSFISIAQSRLRDFVDGCFKSGSLWPDPLIQLNPTFKPGKTVAELVQEGVLATGCKQVFRRDKTAAVGSGEDLLFHQHQEDAIRKAKEGRNYVLTTGTGSGKSLSYIVPIVDHVLRAGSGRGIQAIIIYPMNALANSQYGELEKFLKLGFAGGRGPVTFERYTGQEDEETRTRIIATPPDILLTNYVMLELILTRPREKKLIASAKGLKFLVLDELHTYRGRQGADVALLLRRVRELLNADAMQCVGTSATLAGRGSWPEQCADVARLATRLFGDTVEGSDIIGETLERATAPIDETSAADVAALSAVLAPNARHLPETFDQLAADPVARWVEGTFGIVPQAGRLVRSPSIPLTGKNGAAERLAKLTGASPERCKDVVAETLLAGATRIRHPRTGFPVFAFRLHQFISRGDTLYATVESPEQRYLTIHGQIYSPEDRNKVLLPLCFCRECGQEYYSVYLAKDPQTGVQKFLTREAHERTEVVGQKQGLLYINPQKPWPRDTEMEAQLAWLPTDWVEERNGKRQVIASRRERMPRHYVVKPDGSIGPDGLDAAFIPVPFMFCLGCGVSHTARQRSDFSKLGTLGSEGRSTATTILTTSAVAGLQREETIKPEARKLLSFTDNRQDASLQSGHLNDFIEVGLLRGAIYKAAVAAGAQGLRDDTISQKVTTALGLRFEDYAKDATIKYGRDKVEAALRDVVGYASKRRNHLLAVRRLTNTTNERTAVFSIVPYSGCGNSMFVFDVPTTQHSIWLVACGNSFACDYVARNKLGGTNFLQFIIEQLAVVRFEDVQQAHFALQGGLLENWITPRVLELTYTAWDLEGFAQDCGWSGPPFRWDEERRFLLRCELDAAFFHLYLGPETEWRQQPAALTQAFPTPRAAVAYILDTFPIVKRKDEAKFNGDYRTKRVILEIYDALAASVQTGQPYQTRLDPPPADPRCCHPAKS